MAVHLYGNICNMDELLQYLRNMIFHYWRLCWSHWFWVEFKKQFYGDIWNLFFHGTKTICTGEGGMFVTNDDKIYEKSLTLSNQIKKSKKQFWPDMIGFKYKMSNIQAAIGCAQLERIDELISKKEKYSLFIKRI